MNDIYKSLNVLGIKLPSPPEAEGLYTPALLTGDYLYLSGSGGANPRELPAYGKLGENVSIDDGRLCARGAVIALLSAAEKAVGSLERIERIVKMTGFVNAAGDFTEHPKVIDGASELLIEIFGKEAGRHARSAIGVGSLPFNIPVEIEMILKIRSGR